MSFQPPVPATPGDDGPGSRMRDLLFADLAPDRARDVYLRGGAATAFLVDLANAAMTGDAPAALRAIASVPPPGQESRLHAQAWHLARLAGVDPGSAGRRVLGVIVDMHTEEGLDTLAGFLDGSARYLNYSGAGVVWEAPDADVRRRVDDLLLAGEEVLRLTEPVAPPRPGPPGHGGAMISVLTPGGIHVGTGSVYHLSNDSHGGPVIAAAGNLLALLVQRASAGDGLGG